MGSGTRAVLDQLYTERQLQPQTALEISSNEAIKQSVMAGLGVSLISLHTIGLELSNGLLFIAPVEGTPVMRTWNLVRLGSIRQRELPDPGTGTDSRMRGPALTRSTCPVAPSCSMTCRCAELPSWTKTPVWRGE